MPYGQGCLFVGANVNNFLTHFQEKCGKIALQVDFYF